MGNIITSNDFATPTAWLKSSEQAAFPATNVSDYRHPFRPWKANDCVSGSTYVGIDLGASIALSAIVIDNINIAAIKIQRSDDGSSWTSAATSTLTPDPLDLRYKAYFAASLGTHRYWRVLANTSTTTDGSSAMRVGSFAALKTVREWAANPAFPLHQIGEQACQPNDDFGGGGREPVLLGNRYSLLGFVGQVLPPEMRDDLLTIGVAYTEAEPIVLYLNNGDGGTAPQVYICRRIGDVEVSQAGPHHLTLGSRRSLYVSGISLEECV